MTLIEDYALIGDTHSAALVSNEGSIDWLCLPRFDSPACFAGLLGGDAAGCWRISPSVDVADVSRAYRPDSMVLETIFKTETGTVCVTDCLVLEEHSDPHHPRRITPHEILVRLVTGVDGSVPMDVDYAPRFDYGAIRPWLRHREGAIQAIGGPDSLDLRAEVELTIVDDRVCGSFVVDEGDEIAFVMAYHPSHLEISRPLPLDRARGVVDRTDRFWRDWSAGGAVIDSRREEIVRSLLTLKALTFSPTGGIVAAPTTSLPEAIGGTRNWDYRYCWLRDATFTLDTLLSLGHTAEAIEWRDWLLRAVAGDPNDLQIMYGVQGERRLSEFEASWLAGYENSAPVRIGNAAAEQFQLDVYGEVIDAFHSGRRAGIDTPPEAWELERAVIDFVCDHWTEPDEGIWEVRSGREHFVHSKVMAWVAVDRGISAIRRFAKEGPLDRWELLREAIRADIMERGYDPTLGHFVRAYGETELDASLLMLPLVGFIPAEDDRMRRTIEAIERELMVDGFLLRYRTDQAPDGLPPGEGAFLMCTFWLADCLSLLGRRADAEACFERLLSLQNDVGLLAEQFDPRLGRLTGNFPQAFSHTALITTALELAHKQAGLKRRGN